MLEMLESMEKELTQKDSISGRRTAKYEHCKDN